MDKWVPRRRHKRKRIQKKWIRRYGLTHPADTNIYYSAEGVIAMHPATFRKFERALGGEDKAITYLSSLYKVGGED